VSTMPLRREHLAVQRSQERAGEQAPSSWTSCARNDQERRPASSTLMNEMLWVSLKLATAHNDTVELVFFRTRYGCYVNLSWYWLVFATRSPFEHSVHARRWCASAAPVCEAAVHVQRSCGSRDASRRHAQLEACHAASFHARRTG
jgi:hypothetical protein